MGNSIDINGKICLVTGANRGIGKALVEGLVQAGASKVYATARNIDSIKPLVAELGEKVATLTLDLVDEKTISAALEESKDVEIVINNGGVLKQATPLSPNAIKNLSLEIDVNVNGLIRMAQAYAPVLKTNGGGAFVQINSVASYACFADFATYCASKAAAYSITQGLRQLLNEQGTAVVSVHPGPIKSDMADDAGFGEVAEPPQLVTECIISALKNGEFHAYPDSVAKQMGAAYESFAKDVILAPPEEA